jgi:hypothetical protein
MVAVALQAISVVAGLGIREVDMSSMGKPAKIVIEDEDEDAQ